MLRFQCVFFYTDPCQILQVGIGLNEDPNGSWSLPYLCLTILGVSIDLGWFPDIQEKME